MPQNKDFEGVLKVKYQVVEDYISKPCTYNQTQDQIEIKIIKLSPRNVKHLFLKLVNRKQIGGGKPKNLHKTIPAHSEWPYLEDYRINVRILEHKYTSKSGYGQ